MNQPTPSDRSPADLFSELLPRIIARARFTLRRVRCPDTRDDLAAEAVALAWRTFARLSARGLRPESFGAMVALRASQAALGGRRLAGADTAGDVLSPVARVRRGFAVLQLDGAEVPAASTRGRVPERAAFRIDYPAWCRTLGRRDRAVALALAAGFGTSEVAAAFNVSPGRVAQIRRELCASWHRFHGEDAR